MIPARFLEVVHVPVEVSEVVLTSDGYPEPSPSLEEAERIIAALLEHDPFCINSFEQRKAFTASCSRSTIGPTFGWPSDPRFAARQSADHDLQPASSPLDEGLFASSIPAESGIEFQDQLRCRGLQRR